jgi:hypothetical protein
LTDELIEGKDSSDKNAISSPENNFSSVFKSLLVQRILLEAAFYGILLTGFLAWTSIFVGLRVQTLSNGIAAVLVVLIWMFYGIKFITDKGADVNLGKLEETKSAEL